MESAMVAIKRILCPIDFSEFSRHAIVRATAIAEAHGASITALHVVYPPSRMYTPFPLEIATSAAFQVTPDEREVLRRQLLEFARGARPSAVSLDAQVVDGLTVHDGIVAQGATPARGSDRHGHARTRRISTAASRIRDRTRCLAHGAPAGPDGRHYGRRRPDRGIVHNEFSAGSTSPNARSRRSHTR